jgi:hypothetical protein
MLRPHQSPATGVQRLLTVLENCTEATSAAFDKRRLITRLNWTRWFTAAFEKSFTGITGSLVT